MTDRETLIWLHQRLANVHGESVYLDFMHKLRDIIGKMPKDQDSSGPVVTMLSNQVLDEIRAGERHVQPPTR